MAFALSGRERRRQRTWAVCHWPTRLVRSDFQQPAYIMRNIIRGACSETLIYVSETSTSTHPAAHSRTLPLHTTKDAYNNEFDDQSSNKTAVVATASSSLKTTAAPMTSLATQVKNNCSEKGKKSHPCAKSKIKCSNRIRAMTMAGHS
eukprot:scaffold14288_cov67-Skeletonema_dohrnii-CCMP3373.AAC.2